jgi:predicted RNase H-related nuclease YkuK (DUF458 family)
MINNDDDTWYNSDSKEFILRDIINITKLHSQNNGKIYIGTDSFINKSKCVFATAICLHGADKQVGGKYFFRRVSFEREKFSELVYRITHEVQQSIEIALVVTAIVPDAEIELHLDISPANKQNGTSQFADMLTGFARGSGFNFKIKPNAWASQSVADKHSK